MPYQGIIYMSFCSPVTVSVPQLQPPFHLSIKVPASAYNCFTISLLKSMYYVPQLQPSFRSPNKISVPQKNPSFHLSVKVSEQPPFHMSVKVSVPKSQYHSYSHLSIYPLKSLHHSYSHLSMCLFKSLAGASGSSNPGSVCPHYSRLSTHAPTSPTHTHTHSWVFN